MCQALPVEEHRHSRRDAQERGEVYQRLDQARVDRILSEHDPYNHNTAA